MYRIITTVSLAALTVFTGCAEDPAAEERIYPEVPPEVQLSALTADQRIALCHAVQARSVEDHDLACESTSAAQAGSGPKCEARKSDCLVEAAGAPDPDPCADAAEDFHFEDCRADVGEYLACLQDQHAALIAGLEALTCDNAADVGVGELLDVTISAKLVPSCNTLAIRCPEALAVGQD